MNIPGLDPHLVSRIDQWQGIELDLADEHTLREWLDDAGRGDQSAIDRLHEFFDQPLIFGTAGLRGAMGPGPGGMNTTVVCQAAQAIGTLLLAQSEHTNQPPLVVVGFDGRHRSRAFAEATAAVLIDQGLRVEISKDPIPTPMLAFAVRHCHAAAGIMVTASHNPAKDNGYKVYWGDGRQIISHTDQNIADLMSTQPSLQRVPTAAPPGVLRGDVEAAYLRASAALLIPNGTRTLRVAHTALHGVSSILFAKVLQYSNFSPPVEVVDQQRPDPDFPTVAFPNPEEPGAMKLALELALRENCDLVIAHDPDGDRCAVAIPDPWRMLSGDEVGALIGWWLITRRPTHNGIFASSIVSGTLLPTIATAHQVPFTRTLTGFKWISRVPGLTFGYEEALGYCIDPAHVADKDGITAGLLLCEVAAHLQSTGISIEDLLTDLEATYGTHLSAQVSMRMPNAALTTTLAQLIVADPPSHLAGRLITEVVDLGLGSLSSDFPTLPPTPGLRLNLGDEATIFIRPSGTEPKVKAYLQVHLPPFHEVARGRAVAQGLLDELVTSVESLIRVYL